MTEIANTKSTIDERLENIFRQLLDLYERHAQERQLMMKEKEELVRLVQLLVAQTKEVGQYEQGIRKRIQDCIKDSSEAAMRSVEQKMFEKCNQSIEQLNTTVDQYYKAMRAVIQKGQDRQLFFGWAIIITAIISGVFAGVLITWLFRIT